MAQNLLAFVQPTTMSLPKCVCVCVCVLVSIVEALFMCQVSKFHGFLPANITRYHMTKVRVEYAGHMFNLRCLNAML